MTAPVLILQNLSADGPGYLATWLHAQGVPYRVFDTEAGQGYPASIDGYRALALLGGEMSANDPLPSLRDAERLVLQAMARDLPVIGHCLGGQLMARALGARVGASPRPEVGWRPMQVADTPAARHWFGAAGERTVFHWHAETFDLPAGAERIATGAACPNQAFAVGRHLAMQFHLELDRHKLADWSASTQADYLALRHAHPATVQDGARMRAEAQSALPAQQALADRVYRRWLGG